MSELKAYIAPTPDGTGLAEFYLKSEADKVIADLEESHKKEVEQLLMEIVKLKAKNKRPEEFKDKYKDCAEKAINNIAKCELKIRRLSRALYKTCANWAHHRVFVRFNSNEKAWENMERKCLKKAEEYK